MHHLTDLSDENVCNFTLSRQLLRQSLVRLNTDTTMTHSKL